MRKKKCLPVFGILVILAAGFFLAAGRPVCADESQKIKLTTGDLHIPYIIKGPIHVRTGQPDLEKINMMLLEEAKKLEADCVIGVGYMEAYGYIFGYGTAVKTKEPASNN